MKCVCPGAALIIKGRFYPLSFSLISFLFLVNRNATKRTNMRIQREMNNQRRRRDVKRRKRRRPRYTFHPQSQVSFLTASSLPRLPISNQQTFHITITSKHSHWMQATIT
jgi:hypothetical protein